MSADIGREYHDEDWPHGLRCADCHRLMNEGGRYSEQLVSMADELPVVRIVCVGCAFTPTDVPPDPRPPDDFPWPKPQRVDLR